MWRNGIVPVVAACFLASVFPACRGGGDEERVRGVIEEVRRAVVERDAGGVLDLIADDYADPEGRTKKEIRSLLLYHIIRNQRLTVSVVAPRIVVSGNLAVVRARIVATGSEGGGIFPDNATSRDFDLRFARRGGDWKLVSAVWSGGGRDDAP